MQARQTTFIFILNTPKHCLYGTKKITEPKNVIDEWVSGTQTLIKTEDENHTDFLGKLMPGQLLLLIQEYLNGNTQSYLMHHFNYRLKQWETIKETLNLPQVTDHIIKEQIKLFLLDGATHEMILATVKKATLCLIRQIANEIAEQANKQKQQNEMIYLKLMHTCNGTRLCRNRFMIKRGGKGAVYFVKHKSATHLAKKIRHNT